MSLETYTGYIPALVDSNPTPTDPVSEGDDHVRGIKTTLSTTFAGFTEAGIGVTVRASDINSVCAGGAQSAMPSGMIAAFGMESAPVGWTPCDGGLLSRTNFPNLFAAIGETWGAGDGSTTFQKPDMRGQFARGWNGTTSGDDANRVFATNQASDNLSHTHTINNDTHSHTATISGNHTHAIGTNTQGGSGGVVASAITGTDGQMATAGSHSHTINSDTHNHTAANSGGSESRPVNVAVLYCIKT